jgi:glutamate-1-semialdehyde 2,1-aminomutase
MVKKHNRTGQKLYKRAKKIIPGGNQLLSKRPEMFLPEKWPSYYKKAKGCTVWDLDDNKLIDMSIMGIGTCSLGYANPDVNNAVINSLKNGSFSTLNSYEEVQLAERLLDLHPFMDMVRFSRTGGEANALSIRIGRAASGKDKVAMCGYHGWHDWYLAANIEGENRLEGLLLPGLSPNGVPKRLSKSTLPFQYGNIKELENHIENNHDIGVICVEVQRGDKPDLDFLRKVQVIAKKINAVLIFDEISSGFRLSIGGLYKNYNLEPDVVVLGKALGNGFAISAIMGKKSVMEAAQESFISSSYWTERTGFSAALEVLNQFKEKDVIKYLIKTGEYFNKKLKPLFNKADISIIGMKTVPVLSFNQKNNLECKTFFTQEMLKLGYLASNVIYLSYQHNNKIIDDYYKSVSIVIEKIIDFNKKGILLEHIEGPVCHSGFKRLT